MKKHFQQSLDCAREAYIPIPIVFLLSIAGFSIVGSVYTNTILARGMIEALIAPISTLSFAVITSASTVITLLMAILGFAKRLDNDFDHAFYTRIWFIGTVATIALILSSFVILVISIPITESEALGTWYNVIYVIIVGSASLMMGLLIGMILSLYRTLFALITLSAPSWDS